MNCLVKTISVLMLSFPISSVKAGDPFLDFEYTITGPYAELISVLELKEEDGKVVPVYPVCTVVKGSKSEFMCITAVTSLQRNKLGIRSISDLAQTMTVQFGSVYTTGEEGGKYFNEMQRVGKRMIEFVQNELKPGLLLRIITSSPCLYR